MPKPEDSTLLILQWFRMDSTDTKTASDTSTGTELITRIEQIPLSRWHLRPRVIMGSATFFDAFDALSMAFVLPVLIGAWHLKPTQIGSLISIAYLGQVIGAIFFGFLAERIGRVRSASW